MTYQDILDAECQLKPGPTSRDVNDVMAAAEDNMPDDDGRIDSIICILSYPGHELAAVWFATLGITA